MHQICIASVMQLQSTCIKSGKYCNPDIAKPPFSGIFTHKIALFKNHVFMQKSNAAMHMHCTCYAFALYVWFSAFSEITFFAFWGVFCTCNPLAMHLECKCNAFASRKILP